MGKIYCLGDIHGRYKALQQVFERAGFDYDNDTCIFVGDIVDRGEEPFECMEFIMKLENKILIRGNHDLNFYKYILTGKDFFNGEHGMAITKRLWVAQTPERKEMLTRYFELTVPYYVDVKNRIFTHGGFDNQFRVDEQEEYVFCWDRNLWEQALLCKKGQLVPTVDCFTEIYIGHTATINYGSKEKRSAGGIIIEIGEPITYPIFIGGIWNLDTGAGNKIGKLSMMNVETKEIFQSDLIKTLYGIV